MRFQVYQLANDRDAYGFDAGQWIVVTNDQKDECSGAMDEHDARLLCDCLNMLADTDDMMTAFFGLEDEDEDGGDELHDRIRKILRRVK